MTNAIHSRQTAAEGIHGVIAFTYANAAGRTGAAGFASYDIGKIALQLDDGSYWILTSIAPTWTQVNTGGSSTDPDAIHDNVAGEIAAITEKVVPIATDLLIIEDSALGNVKRKVQVGNLPTGGGGEANTGANVGTGAGVFRNKTGITLNFRSINAASTRISSVVNVDNVDIDVVQANLDIGLMGGSLASDLAHGNRGGGTLHAAATTLVAGFLSAADKTKLDGIATGATNTPLTAVAPVNVTKAAAAVGVSTDAARSDHKHDVSTAAPSVGIGAGNAEGTATTLARSDHNHAIRETGGPTDLTLGAIADGEVIRRAGATIAGGVGKRYPNAAIDPVSPAPAAGDTYFNTSLNTLMEYDGSRSKWLSVSENVLLAGRNGNTAAGTYYRGSDSIILSATSGFTAWFNGTVVAIGYTRTDTDAATFEVTANGTTVASLASSAVSGRTTSVDGNFAAGDVLAIRNAGGGNTTSDVQVWARVKWRV